jgi:hypothetical protein
MEGLARQFPSGQALRVGEPVWRGVGVKAFWHSSDQIRDGSTLAQLALAFDAIVVPMNVGGGYFPHSQLQLPPMPADATDWQRKYPFAPSSVRKDPAFYPGSAFSDWERAYVEFGQEFADAQYVCLHGRFKKKG